MIDAEMGHLVTDLQTLIKQPSISAKNEGIIDCARVVAQLMKNAGIQTEILTLDRRGEREDEAIAPVIYGEVKSKAKPNSKTLLFYNHYDVQPVEPVELWEEDPFSGKVKAGKIYGRGSTDDKGELITRMISLVT
jgi:acetylornithine deacetylase/succinyl-diaminopimelate desuccinylase-like protein